MDPKRKFKGLLARIFSDAKVEPDEQAELSSFIASGTLGPADIQEVLADFVQTTWKITVADGVVSELEKTRLREIVRVLQLDRALLPPEWAAIVQDHAQPN